MAPEQSVFLEGEEVGSAGGEEASQRGEGLAEEQWQASRDVLII